MASLAPIEPVCALPMESKPVDSVGGLLAQHLGEVEQEAADKGGVQAVQAVQAVLAGHFA